MLQEPTHVQSVMATSSVHDQNPASTVKHCQFRSVLVCPESCHSIQGDYDQQLIIKEATRQRKTAFLDSLLDATARHMVLQRLQDVELQRLQQLQDMLQTTTQLLADFKAASDYRSNR